VNQGAKLTSDLLVRKGHAIPTGGFAHVGADLSQLLWPPAKLDTPCGDSVLAPSAPDARASRARSPKRRSGAAEQPRIALTLRLDRARHRRLKRLCARGQRTIQELLVLALDAYLEAWGSDGACVRGKPKDSAGN
jgi:hypothetical protein